MYKFLILFWLCLIFFDLHAQFRIGFTGGGISARNSLKNESHRTDFYDIILYYPEEINFTKRSGEFSSRYSYYLGLTADVQLTYSLFIKAKLLIDNKGWKENFKENGHWDNGLTGPPWAGLMGRSDSISATEIFKLSYLTLPIYISFYAPLKGSNAQLFFGVGAYLSYGLIGHYRFKLKTSTFPPDVLSDSVTEVSFHSGNLYRSAAYHANTFDYGLSANAGIEFRNGFFIDFSYSYGLKDVVTDHYNYVDPYSQKAVVSLSNRNIAFYLGVGFYLKK